MLRRLSLAARVIIALIVLIIGTVWLVPRVDAGVAAWLKAAPIRARTVHVADKVVVAVVGGPSIAAGRQGEPKATLRSEKAPQVTSSAAPSSSDPVAPALDTIDAGFGFDMVGVLLRCPVAARPALIVNVRTSNDGVYWSEWWPLDFTSDGPRGSVESPHDAASQPAWVGSSRYLQYAVLAHGRAVVHAPASVSDVRFVFLNVAGDGSTSDRLLQGLKTAAATIAGVPAIAPAAAMTSTPTIVTRSQWGANESWRKSDPDYETVKMAFVHHTAGSNNYSRAQSASIVRGVYYYHAQVLGWDDIGYNFLIDRYGTIYEGRYGGVTRGPIGAHVYGFNTGSTGVSVMGNFSSSPPPAATIASLKELLAWKLDVHHVDPLGTAVMTCRAKEKYAVGQKIRIPVISPHRLVNYTACPGDAFNKLLPSIRKAVAGMGLPKIYDFGISVPAFSPNGDGRIESVTTTFTVSESADWTVEARNAQGVVVRTVRGTGTAVTVVWAGRNDAGALVPDGLYTLTVRATSPRGKARPAAETVLIDTIAPTLKSNTVRPLVLSPNDDHFADATTVNYETTERDWVRFTIRNAGGVNVRRVFDWTSRPAGQHTGVWDGKTGAAGDLVTATEGVYTLELALRDRADNRAVFTRTATVNLTLGFPVAKPTAFSPNGDGRRDSSAFSVQLAAAANVTVTVNDGGTVVRTFDLGSRAAGPASVTWAGRDQTGHAAPDRAYRFVVTAVNSRGTVRLTVPVVRDTVRPVVSASATVRLALGGRAKVTYAVKDSLSALAHVTAVVSRPSGRIVKELDLGWVRTGTGHVCVFRPSATGTYLVAFRATDAARNTSSPATVTTLLVD